MSGSEISKAIAKATGTNSKATQKDALEKQVDAAEFYGVIKSDQDIPQPKKRGRPPTKSKSPGPPPREEPPTPRKEPGAQKKPTDEGVKNIINEMKRTSLIAKVRACAAWWPELCSETLKNTNIYLCTTEQLEMICKGFEETVMIQSEIVDIPRTFKQTIAKVEPVAVGIGIKNSAHPFWGQLRKLNGLGQALHNDPAVDRNVKLLSLRFLGKMPRSPLLSLVWSVVMCGLEVIKENTMNEMADEIPGTEDYAGL